MTAKKKKTKNRWHIWLTNFFFKGEDKKPQPHPFIIIGVDKNGSIVGYKTTSRKYHKGDSDFYRIKYRGGTGLSKDTYIDTRMISVRDIDLLKHKGVLSKIDRRRLQYHVMKNNERSFRKK